MFKMVPFLSVLLCCPIPYCNMPLITISAPTLTGALDLVRFLEWEEDCQALLAGHPAQENSEKK